MVRKTFQNLKAKMLWIPGNIWGMSIAIGLISVSVSMTYSVSPLFLTRVLGLSFLSLGVIEGFTEGLSQITKLFSGMSGDYFRRKKPTLMAGFFLSVFSKPFFILAQGAGLVVLSKVIERISNGVMSTPRDAYIADAAPIDRRGAAFGLLMSFKTGGCVVGSLLIGGLLLFMEDYRFLLWIGFSVAVLSMIVLYFTMHEKEPQKDKKTHSTHYKIKWADIKKLDFKYWSLLLVASLFMCARFNDGFLVLRMKELGGSDALCASLIGIFNLVSLLCCFPIGRLSDKIGHSRVLYFSIITLMLSNFCLIFAQGTGLAMLGVIFWGAQRATSQILFLAIIAKVAPQRIMGTSIGLFFLMIGGISLIAGTIGGWVGDHALQFTFVFGLIMSTCSMLCLIGREKILEYRQQREAFAT